MKLYHGTSEESWILIQEEQVLWDGYSWHETGGKSGYRYTYLTPEIDIAMEFGSVVLEVEYEPVGIDGREIDNYVFPHEIPPDPPGMICWQFSVFVPIPIDQVGRIAPDMTTQRQKK